MTSHLSVPTQHILSMLTIVKFSFILSWYTKHPLVSPTASIFLLICMTCCDFYFWFSVTLAVTIAVAHIKHGQDLIMRSAYVHEIYVSRKLRRYPAFSARFFLLSLWSDWCQMERNGFSCMVNTDTERALGLRAWNLKNIFHCCALEYTANRISTCFGCVG